MSKINIIVRGNQLWFDTRIRGKRYRYSSGLENTKHNMSVLKKNAIEEFTKIHNERNTVLEQSMTFQEYGTYVLEVTKNERNAFTHKENLQKFRDICKTFGDVALNEIKPSNIRAWQNSLKLQPKTVRNYRSVFNIILKMATMDELIMRNPLKAVKTPKVIHTRPEVYTIKEVKKILSTAEGKYRAFFQLAFFSGMRPGELIALEWSKIDFDHNKILVDKRIREGVEDLPKGGKVRLIDMLPQTKDALKYMQKETALRSKYVFLTRNGNGYYQYDYFNDKFQSVCEKAGVRVDTLYNTKDTFTTLMLQTGQNETWLTQQIGHDEIATTRRHYIGNIKPDEKKFLELVI